MNNEDKRFKQINRIATPIKVEPNSQVQQNVTNENRTNEQVKQSVSAIPPKKEVKKVPKQRKKIEKETLIKTLIVIFVIGIIASSIYLIIPSSIKLKKITYNDVTTTTTNFVYDKYFESVKLSDNTFLDEEIDYKIGDFNIRKSNNRILINNKEIAKKEFLYSTFGTIDDLLIFTAKGVSSRTTELYAVDKLGNIVLDMYHIGDINGFVIADEDESVVINSSSITIVSKNVINDKIIPNNTIGDANATSICDEDALFAASIEVNKPVIVYYSLNYKGNHEFDSVQSIYEESMSVYKTKNGYCK